MTHKWSHTHETFLLYSIEQATVQPAFIPALQHFVLSHAQTLTCSVCSRGPSKKEMKEMQKAQEEEMLALFNAVPKKQTEVEQKEEELDPETGPTFTDITQEIEYQRANVVAKTRITDAVFQYAPLRDTSPPATTPATLPLLPGSRSLHGHMIRCTRDTLAPHATRRQAPRIFSIRMCTELRPASLPPEQRSESRLPTHR